MTNCLILDCNSTKDPADQSGDVRFFEFPPDLNLRQLWCHTIEAYQGPLQELTAVCERHFAPEAFLPDGQLMPDAVPIVLETESRNRDGKSLLEILTGAVVKLESGGIRCGLKEDNVACIFTQERFESRSLLRHICDVHTGFAASVELIGEKTAKDKIGAKRVKLMIRDRISGWQKKVLKHVSKESNGYYCRIDGSNCTYFQSSLNSYSFVLHFRKVHPVQAFDNGFIEGIRRKEILLTATYKLVKSKVYFDGNFYRCNLPPCDFSITSLDTEAIRLHICENHASIANQYDFFNKNPTKQTHRRTKKSSRKNLSSEIEQKVKENVTWDDKGIVRCTISGALCSYKKKKFDPANFYCHFSVRHPNEVRTKGLCSVAKSSDESSESEAPSTPMDTEDDLSRQNFPQSMVSEDPSEIIEENEDSDLMLTTPSDDATSYCRLCFSIARPLLSIFAGPEDGAELIELISSCTNIRLCASSDAPSSVCLECKQKLDEIQRFRQLAATLDAVVRQQGRFNKNLDVESDEEFVENQTVTVESAQKTEDKQAVEYLSDTSVEMISDNDKDTQHTSFENKLISVTVHGKKYYKCPACGFLARLTNYVVCHWRHVHAGGNNLANKITCTEAGCSEIFFLRKNLRQHLKMVHNRVQTKTTANLNAEQMYVQLAENKFACRNCGQFFATMQLAVTHYQGKHRVRRRVTPSSALDQIYTLVTGNGAQHFQCRDCDVMMTRKSDIAIHWLQQHKVDDGGQ